MTCFMSALSSPAQKWPKKVCFTTALVTVLPSTLVDRLSSPSACLTRSGIRHARNTAMARRISKVLFDPCAEAESAKSTEGSVELALASSRR